MTLLSKKRDTGSRCLSFLDLRLIFHVQLPDGVSVGRCRGLGGYRCFMGAVPPGEELGGYLGEQSQRGIAAETTLDLLILG